MSRKRKNEVWSCDFETTTDPNDCRVWAWGASNVFDVDTKYYGNTMQSFIDWIFNKNKKLYFHNLAFDGEFIVSWLLSNGFSYTDKPKTNTFKTIISKQGLWYCIEIYWSVKGKHTTKTVVWDSLKLIPFSVEQIAIDFKLPIRKLKIDYDEYREIGHELTQEEKDYLFNDIDIIALALQQCFNEGFDKMTATASSFKAFKETLPEDFEKIFPVISLETDKDIRPSYMGGFVWANERFKEKVINEGIVFDVNSLYPSRMYTELLPYGAPVFFKGEPQKTELYPLWICKVSFAFELKEEHIECISLDRFSVIFGSKKYVKSSDGDIVTMVLTNVDWELINEQYNVYDVNWYSGYKFKGVVGIANKFIDDCMEVKKKEHGVKRFIAKRKMNSVYGKFATNPDVTPKIPYLDDSGVLKTKLPTYTTYENGKICEVEDKQERDPIYLPYGAFVTAYARKYTISTAQKVGINRVAYIDTDSMHLVGTEIPKEIEHIIDDKELGYWGLESVFKRAYFIGAKAYIEEIEISYKDYYRHQEEFIFDHDKKDNLYYMREGVCYRLNVKCAGMTEKAKQNITLNNFRVGNEVPDCLKKVHVKGGVVLYDRKFKIKRR